MPSHTVHVDQQPNHIGGNFEWEIPPSCCDLLRAAIDEERFVFVSNFTEGGYNMTYILPVTADAYLARSDGVSLAFCPWCGTKIALRKHYADSRSDA